MKDLISEKIATVEPKGKIVVAPEDHPAGCLLGKTTCVSQRKGWTGYYTRDDNIYKVLAFSQKQHQAWCLDAGS
jgi:hypothetical protein